MEKEFEYGVQDGDMTVTLTPAAERTMAALERYYDLGGAYDIAHHDTIGYYQ